MSPPPRTPEVPDAPATTGAFGVSGQKDVPGVPHHPGVTGASSMSSMTDTSNTPDIPIADDAPAVPDATGHPEAPDVTERDLELAGWINGISSDPALAGMVAKKLREISAARGLDFGGLESLVEDVISDLIVLTWRKRAEWGQFSEDRRRGWMFRAAQNLTRQAGDRAHRQRRDEAHAVQEARIDLLSIEEAPTGDRAILAAIGQRVAAVPGMGVPGWDKVQDAALRSKRTQAVFRQIRQDVQAGRPWTVRALVAPVLRWEDWAAERRKRGLSLSTAAAVADGAFSSGAEAQRHLVVWWALRRHPAFGAPTASQILAAGLVDHVQAQQRQSAAVAVALGLSTREPRREAA